MPEPLKIWCNVRLPKDLIDRLRREIGPNTLLLPDEVPGHHLVRGKPDEQLLRADIAYGQPDPQQVIDTPSIRWVHISSAGYTRYDTPAFLDAIKARGGAFTNSSSVYDEPCAQHILAMMLAFSRRLPDAWEEQHTRRGWPKLRPMSFLLRGQTVLIYGYGAIGQRLAEMLQPFGMTVYAVRRTPKGPNQFTPEQADELLGQADHIANTLPASATTERFFNADRFGRMKRGAFFYNIGRGSTVDQPAILEALTSRHIGGAYLDVTTPEPLPPDSPLWTAPNCCITPHSAGGHVDEYERLLAHFLANLRRYTASETLLDRIV